MASTSRDKASSRKKVKVDKELSEDITVHETSGFKFSRQSRYRKGKGSSTKSARKKRRSSFVRGRKERKSLVSLPAVSSKSELYKDIPKDLPPVKRLTKLFDACLESALEKLDSELLKYGADDIPDFSSEAKEVFNHLRNLVSESDIVHEALKLDERNATLVPNPRNEELEVKAATRLAVSESLKVENEKWETLLSSHQDQAEKMERECKEDENLEVTDHCLEFLSNKQQQLLSGKPSLNSLMENLESLKRIAILQVDKVHQTVNTIKQYEEACWEYVNQQTCTFGKTTFEAIDEFGTPRTMIRNQLQKL